MILPYSHIIVGLVGAIAAYSYQDLRYSNQILEMNLAKTNEVLDIRELAMADYIKLQGVKDEAIKQAMGRATINAKVAADVSASADRLRTELNKANTGISTATRSSLNEYTIAISDVFGDCTNKYRELAEKATGHANDVKMITNAWPK